MISAEKNENLSKRSYNINSQDATKVIKLSKKKVGKFKALALENNKDNGM